MPASPNLASSNWDIADLIRAAAGQEETTNNVVRLTDAAPSATDPESSWTETWELVAQATETIRSNNDRITSVEHRNRELETTYADQVRALQARMKAVDQLLERTEAARAAADGRASQAEARAASAEEFLRRIGAQVRGISR